MFPFAEKATTISRMSIDILKTAILGLNGQGSFLSKAASKCELIKLESVADRDGKLAEKTAAELDCDHFDDYRQLIMHYELDCLIVADAFYDCHDLLRHW